MLLRFSEGIAMKLRNISVTFHVDVRDNKPWFQVPTSLTSLLGLKAGNGIAISVTTQNGDPLYHVLAKLGPTAQSCPVHIPKRLKKGKEIRVTLSSAPEGNLKG